VAVKTRKISFTEYIESWGWKFHHKPEGAEINHWNVMQSYWVHPEHGIQNETMAMGICLLSESKEERGIKW